MKTLLTIFLALTVHIQILQVQAQKVELSLHHEIDHSVKSGLKWLLTQQEKDGSWQHYPAITALVLSSFLRAHPSINAEDTLLSDGFEFLERCVQPDGGIYLEDMPTYNTSICLMAFKDARSPRFEQIIINAENYLMRTQFDLDESKTKDSLYYGGIGYGGDDRPDLSNLQWAISALALNDNEPSNPEEISSPEEKERTGKKQLFYDQALVFLSRCQNLQSVNPEKYSGNDGGFIYEPGASKAGGTQSYGTMTYAGLKSLIYAKVDKNDIRVKAAFGWLQNNYSVTEVPGMGKQGLYYYYHTMAKSLNAYGENEIAIPNKGVRKWRDDLADQLIKIQTAEGFWVNENGRWWENNPVLVTAYCVLALEEIAGLPSGIINTRKMVKKR